jgi:Caspase domain
VRNNIEGLKRLFTDPDIAGIPEDNILIIQDKPNASDIATQIADSANMATDTLIFYYAGHGLIGRQQSTLHLAVQDTTDRRVDYNAISIDDIKQAIAESPASKKIMILDCCFSGRGIEIMGGEDSLIRASIDLKGTYAIASAPATKAAAAPKGEKYTTFTGELINLIEKGIDNGKDGITLEEVYQNLRRALNGRPGVPLPERVNFRDLDQLVICRNKKAKSPEATLEPANALAAPEKSLITNIVPLSITKGNHFQADVVHRCVQYQKFVGDLSTLPQSAIQKDESDLFLLFLNAKSPSGCEKLRKYFRTEDFPEGARRKNVSVEGIYDIYGQFDFLIKLRFKDRNLEPIRLIASDLRKHRELIAPCTCDSAGENHGNHQNRGGDKCLQCGITLINVTKEFYPGKWLPLQKEDRMKKAFLHVYGWKAARVDKILPALYPNRHEIKNVAMAGLYFAQHKNECQAVAEYYVGCGGFYDLVNLILNIEQWLDLDAERTTLLVMQAEREKSPHQLSSK